MPMARGLCIMWATGRYFEAARRFGHVLEASGVTEDLRQRGIREGDTVVIGEVRGCLHAAEHSGATSNDPGVPKELAISNEHG